MLDKAKYQRILTYEEAVRGTQDDDFMCAINRTTSPGFPYTLTNKGSVGKTKWMGKNEQFDFDSMAESSGNANSLTKNYPQPFSTTFVSEDVLPQQQRFSNKFSPSIPHRVTPQKPSEVDRFLFKRSPARIERLIRSPLPPTPNFTSSPKRSIFRTVKIPESPRFTRFGKTT
jgi:hypothetical protein